MNKKTDKKGWLYEYESAEKYRKTYNCELTDVRYVLGERFDERKEKALICIGINPSMALPNFLDSTLKRVQEYAKRSGDYGAWYMLNIYPQRATNPKDMDTDNSYDLELHFNNIKAIKNLLSDIGEADIWCAWGAIIKDSKRTFLTDLLYGNKDKGIKGIMSLFSSNHHFKAYGATTKGYPKHPLLLGSESRLKNLEEVGLSVLSDRINSIIKN